MGLVLGFGVMGAVGGGTLTCICFCEARRLLSQGHRLPAAGFAIGAAVCAAVALGGAWLAWGIADAFLF